jgi:predicted AAA+ superfamily ATPase
MYLRHITANIRTALADTPVVLVNGARQTGKSTLVQSLIAQGYKATYLTMDDSAVLAACTNDPAGFLAGFDGPLILDEVQRAPQLFSAIKAQVDKNRRPGRYLLTGSANMMLLPKIAESLAGRIEIITLWPISRGETDAIKEQFIDTVFAGSKPVIPQKPVSQSDIFDILLAGGYPEVLSRQTDERKKAWFGSYITTILQRDVRDIANIEGLTAMPRLLSLLASRVSALLNLSELSRSIGIPQNTLKRYMVLLETTFLLGLLPAWSNNLGKRLMKSPKINLNDSGLLCYLLGMDKERLGRDRQLTGSILENFVVMELRKQATWSIVKPNIFHLRSPFGQEVDIVLEDSAGDIVGIEVKLSGTVDAKDFNGLKFLADMAKKKFIQGIVLYTGAQYVPFGKDISAVPIGALWQ